MAEQANPPRMAWVKFVAGPMNGKEIYPGRDPVPLGWLPMHNCWDDDVWSGCYRYSADCKTLVWTPLPKERKRPWRSTQN